MSLHRVVTEVAQRESPTRIRVVVTGARVQELTHTRTTQVRGRPQRTADTNTPLPRSRFLRARRVLSIDFAPAHTVGLRRHTQTMSPNPLNGGGFPEYTVLTLY